MKSIIKLTCIMMALLSMLVIAGCSNKPDYTGTWRGYDGENALYRLTIQENGKEYMVTEDTYFYIPEKDLPKPNLFALFVTANDNLPNTNNKYDIKYILQKQSNLQTGKRTRTNIKTSLAMTKDALCYVTLKKIRRSFSITFDIKKKLLISPIAFYNKCKQLCVVN